jgi:hypothetical protein
MCPPSNKSVKFSIISVSIIQTQNINSSIVIEKWVYTQIRSQEESIHLVEKKIVRKVT